LSLRGGPLKLRGAFALSTHGQSAFRPLRPSRNLTSELVARLSQAIMSGSLAPNSRLPTEHEMIASFGVSRTVVREALAVLRAEGLVETRQGSGGPSGCNRFEPLGVDPERPPAEVGGDVGASSHCRRSA
jgi:GntR family transcriptional regulator, transcriptional repressor for pyruvate dehydrogenase complex